MKILSSVKSFNGQQIQFQHTSEVTSCEMQASIYLPPQAQSAPIPVLYWLSGLTCTDQNFVTKAGAQAYAAKYGIAIVCPDTSPRGEGVPDDPEQAWDFGLGAGFYVNATADPWKKHYQMYDYIVHELPTLILENFAIDSEKASISGHSMGGHGALTIGLRNPSNFRSISAFSPIVAPSQCPWGEKAFSHYLGKDRNVWTNYDACELLGNSVERLPILIDQGTADSFLQNQLKTELIEAAADSADYPIQVRYQSGYDHSYFFIASFIEEHLNFHSQYLNAN